MGRGVGRFAAIVGLVSLIGGATALASGSSIKVKAPRANVRVGRSFDVTVSGNALGKNAKRLRGFEGGYTNGRAIKCKASYSQEVSAYPSLTQQVYAVHGHFKQVYGYTATHAGSKAFCAYLTNKSGTATSAHASAHWSNG